VQDHPDGNKGGAILFARSARCLQDAARAAGLEVPAFRSPPRRRDIDRTIRRLAGGAVVAVRVHGRGAAAVQHDMVEGILATNRLDGTAANRIRGLLHRALAQAAPIAGHSNAA
jgi:hypothetical protein